jgi:hypothetical protein
VRVEQEDPTAKQTDTINYGQKRHTSHMPHSSRSHEVTAQI